MAHGVAQQALANGRQRSTGVLLALMGAQLLQRAQ